jgi:hypothetical protein
VFQKSQIVNVLECLLNANVGIYYLTIWSFGIFYPIFVFCAKNNLATLKRTDQKNSWSQCDQIGRIFAYWAIIFVGKSFKNYTRSPNSRAAFFPPKKQCINFGKKRRGQHFGVIFSLAYLVTLPGANPKFTTTYNASVEIGWSVFRGRIKYFVFKLH